MDISEVAKASGVSASALRFYEEKGLIRSIGRKGLKRLFSPGIVEQLAVITLASQAGFSLAEIRSMMNPQRRIDRTRLLAKADALDRKIRQMTAMRNGLRHAAACAAPNHFECPKFLRLLRLSTRNRHNHPRSAQGRQQ